MAIELIVTGFPHTGTSFLAELCQVLGVNFGTPSSLKGKNSMNRHGHFENRAIQRLVRKHIGNGKPLNPSNPEVYDCHSDPPDPDTLQEISRIAEGGQITGFKETFYPACYSYFPDIQRLVTIDRNPWNILESPIKSHMPKHAADMESLLPGYVAWWNITSQLIDRIPSLNFRYESFFQPATFQFNVLALASFLGLTPGDIDWERVVQVFDPKVPR